MNWQHEEFCSGEDVLHLDCINVIILVVIVHHSFLRCYHFLNWGIVALHTMRYFLLYKEVNQLCVNIYICPSLELPPSPLGHHRAWS